MLAITRLISMKKNVGVLRSLKFGNYVKVMTTEHLIYYILFLDTNLPCVSGLNAVFRTGNPFLSKRNKRKEKEPPSRI